MLAALACHRITPNAATMEKSGMDFVNNGADFSDSGLDDK
jgi:hypothetical protein